MWYDALFQSPYLWAVVAAWIIAQGAKFVIATIRNPAHDNRKQLYLSGGMPSAHSASVVALAVVIGIEDGIGTGLFALALLFAAVVMYDAVMVRRSSGEQGATLLRLLQETKSHVPPPRVTKGHTPLEVVVGALLGCVIGVLSTMIFGS